MAFGQPSGPPASHSKMRELLELVEQAGHADFRDARGALGLTQRQAGGKFTADEADALIQELQEELWAEEAAADGANSNQGRSVKPIPKGRSVKPIPKRGSVKPIAKTGRTRASRDLEKFKDEELAAELQRRGWVVLEP